MKYLLVVACLLCLSTAAFAANPNANINKGDTSVGGSVTLSYNTVGGTYFYVNPNAQYFIADNFSLGGSISYTSYSGSNIGYVNLGPAMTYYFWSQEKMAAFLGVDFTVNATSNSSNNVTFDGDIGLDWFVVPTVAFGPKIQFSHTFINPDSASNSYYSLLAMFSVFL